MSNQLIFESSPYLQQHANNPVHWFTWSEEAFNKAIEEKKPVFLSIGYSSCHWCHVMEKESFENKEIAEIMNTHFININGDGNPVCARRLTDKVLEKIIRDGKNSENYGLKAYEHALKERARRQEEAKMAEEKPDNSS